MTSRDRASTASPFGQATGGGILYNKKVFAKLGL